MKKGKFASCCRPLMGVVTVGALALGVSALAAPRPVDDSAVRGTNKGKTEVTRLVTGDPAQINAVVAGGTTATAILAVTPVPALVDPGANNYTIAGNTLSRDVGGFRAWFNVQLSHWDDLGDNVHQGTCLANPTPPNCPTGLPGANCCTTGMIGVPCFFNSQCLAEADPGPCCTGAGTGTCDGHNDCDAGLRTSQVKIDCTGYVNGIGDALANPSITCSGVQVCVNAFGESWTKCELGKCKAGYNDKSGTKHLPDNWCAENSAGSGESCDAGDVATALGCNYNFFAVYGGTRKDNHIVYYGGTMVLDIPAGARGLYCADLNHDETFLSDTAAPPADIATAQENGFCVDIKLGSCCHNLGTPEAGCTDDLLRGECETTANAPYFWSAGGDCLAPPGPEGCRQCLLVGRNTDPMCNDSDACTDDDCTPIYTCTHSAIAGWDQVLECCEGNAASAVITTLDDGDVCTLDTCVDLIKLPPPAMENGTAYHDPVAALGLTCNDGNSCSWPDKCDGIHGQNEIPTGCVGKNINSYVCDSLDDCLLNSVQYPCGSPGPEGFCYCTLTPKATFDLARPSGKTCIGGTTPGAPCAKDADCPGGGTCDLFADGANCFDSGAKITALVHFGSSGGPVNGGQLLMTYDPSCVDYNSATCLAPYTRTVYGPIVNEGAGTIFIVCGVDPFAGVNGPQGNVDMVSLSFNKVGECNKCELCFANNNPQNSYLVDDEGQRVDIEPQCKSLQDKGDLVLDVPDNIKTNADCDGPTALETWDPPTATFSCPEGADLICRGAHESGMNMDAWVMGGGVFPAGFSSFCCYAWALGECDQHVGCPPDLGANDCAPGQGKPVGCWTVEVTDEVSLDIVVQLEPPIVTANHDGTLTRCIKFCLFADTLQEPICYDEDVTFGGMYNFIGKSRGKIKVAGTQNWGCITAQDQLHTLRSCYLFQAGDCDEGQLHAQFSGDPAFGGYGSWLIGGNLDGFKKVDDNGVVTNPDGASLDVIDILDYGMFVWQYGVTYADNDTPCGTAGPNADINGDGVVTMADYNFIIRNFMVSAKDCCGGPQAASLPPGLTEVSVDQLRQMGLGDLVVADLNGDGLVNAQDMDAFMQGARPTKTSNDRGGKGLRSGR